jgi:REP element-mobilizing transposase RayT
MARAWRIEYEGAYYHILSRGNDQKEIFLGDADRDLFIKTLAEACERFDVELFAYVLMPNHYHLLMRTHRANLSRAMHWFSGTYTRRFNIRHQKSGHLFQGRFKSILVQNDAYVMQLSCYIHRNPLRAGIVNRLADYAWSSYLFYAYGRKAPDWLSTQLILSQFNPPHRHQAYRHKVQRYAHEEKLLWEDFRHGLLLGSAKFVESVRERFLPESPVVAIPQQLRLAREKDFNQIIIDAADHLGCVLHPVRERQRFYGVDKDKRNLLIYWVWNSGRLTNAQIGELFGLTYTAVSHNVQDIKKKLRDDKELAMLWDHVTTQFKL